LNEEQKKRGLGIEKNRKGKALILILISCIYLSQNNKARVDRYPVLIAPSHFNLHETSMREVKLERFWKVQPSANEDAEVETSGFLNT
jgi:hypothetical protein